MRGKRERTKTVKYIWSGLLFLAVSGILTLIARISLSFSEWYSTYIYSFRVQEGRKKSNLAMACGIVFGRLYYAVCICDQLRHQLS